MFRLSLSQHLRMWTMGCKGEEVISHITVNIWVTESKENGVFATHLIVLRSADRGFWMLLAFLWFPFMNPSSCFVFVCCFCGLTDCTCICPAIISQWFTTFSMDNKNQTNKQIHFEISYKKKKSIQIAIFLACYTDYTILYYTSIF